MASLVRLTFFAALAVVAFSACRQPDDRQLTADQLRQLGAGIAAMPQTAVVVLRLDLQAIASTPLAATVGQALRARHPGVAALATRLATGCGGSIAQLGEVVVGVAASREMGAYPTVIAAHTLLPSESVVSCMRALTGVPGEAAVLDDLPVLFFSNAGGGVWMMQTGQTARGSQWLLANRQDMLRQAVVAARGGPSVLSNSRLAPQLVVAGQGNAPLWAVGLVPPGFAESLRVRSQDRLANGPSALILRVGVRGGLRLTMIAQMASAADANSLKLLINDEVGALSMAAQAWRLGRLVAAIEVEAVGTTVVANGTYSEREIEQLLAAIDNSWPNQQDAPPTPGLPPGGT